MLFTHNHNHILITFLLIGLGLFNSCAYNNEEALYPDEIGCNTVDVSYTNDILPIIRANCYRCHDAQNNFAGITLEGHSNLVTHVDNGRLLGAVRGDNGFVPMPLDASQLSDCAIQQIERWIENGAPNN